MTTRPILFSASMVQAMLDGTKTQTRRVVKCPHKPWKGRVYDKPWTVVPHSGGGWRAVQHREDGSIPGEASGAGFPCPYGVPGDRLWVRESAWIYGQWWKDGFTKRGRQRWTFAMSFGQQARYERPRDEELTYFGSAHPGFAFRPSIHVPRWASRLTLEITDVRVERLQEMAGREERGESNDALSEGIQCVPDELGPCYGLDGKMTNRTGYAAFARLWNSLNEERGFGWHANPYVWVVSFRRAGAPCP